MLVHLEFPGADPVVDRQEFLELARAAGAYPVATLGGRREEPDAGLFIGSGKADEAARAVAESGAELKKRIAALPGFGEQKASIFVALLGKQYGVTPPGWREAAGAYGAEGSRISVADVTDPESLALVRAAKKAAKAAAKAAKTG